jgi:hypothetical protein
MKGTTVTLLAAAAGIIFAQLPATAQSRALPRRTRREWKRGGTLKGRQQTRSACYPHDALYLCIEKGALEWS